jgi:hypothetical protein
VSGRLYELETREQVVRSQLALANGPDVVELHPQVAERYAAKVADIHAALSRGDEAGHEAIALGDSSIAPFTRAMADVLVPHGATVRGPHPRPTASHGSSPSLSPRPQMMRSLRQRETADLAETQSRQLNAIHVPH